MPSTAVRAPNRLVNFSVRTTLFTLVRSLFLEFTDDRV